MNPERWRRIDELFQRAIDTPTADRVPLLERETAGDTGLRREVLPEERQYLFARRQGGLAASIRCAVTTLCGVGTCCAKSGGGSGWSALSGNTRPTKRLPSPCA